MIFWLNNEKLICNDLGFSFMFQMFPSLKARTFLWKNVHAIKRSYQASAKIPDLTKVIINYSMFLQNVFYFVSIHIQDRYQVTRGNYSQVTDTDVKQFQSILDNSRVLLDEDETQSYNIDFMKSVRGEKAL